MKTKTAFILAAGFGKRLYPLTKYLPKPLVPICDKPILQIIIENLIHSGIQNIGINSHHLPEKINEFIENRNFDCNFQIFHEKEILGTGGALANAKNFLEKEDFFILHNGDILTDLDISSLIHFHEKNNSLVTMVLRDFPPKNMVSLSPQGFVRDIGGRLGKSDDRVFTYTGISAISRDIFRYLPKSGYFDLIQAYLRAIQENPAAIRGFLLEKEYWNDIGTIDKYLEANQYVMKNPHKINLHNQRGMNYKFNTEKIISGDFELDFGRKAVIGRDFVITQRQKDVVLSKIVQRNGFTYRTEASLISGQGSDRAFWRVMEKRKSAVLMETTKEDSEFTRFVEIGKFLHKNNLGAPQIFDFSEEKRRVLMEDLGDKTLYEFVKASGQDEIYRIYQKVLDFLVDWQTRGTKSLGQCNLAGDRLFDYDTLRWETDYFRERFLVQFAHVKIEKPDLLEKEFHRLAKAVLEQPVVFMHRDFQSQNILIQDNQIRVVDFQGARRGALCYDLMSLLRDSYVEIGDEMRAALLEYYRAKLQEQGYAFSSEELSEMGILAGLQRNMQALGAFGFLSLVKGKTQFQQYIPLGLKHLRQGFQELHGKCRFAPLNYVEDLVKLFGII